MLHSSGNSNGFCISLEGWAGEADDREVQKRGDICIPMADSRRRHWHSTPVLLPGKSHGWRSLVGCRPWGCEESDMAEQLHFHFSLLCIGEGNGNPLHCPCLGWGRTESDTTEVT